MRLLMTSGEIIDIEPIEEIGGPTVAALATVDARPSTALVRPAAAISEVVDAFHAYQEVYSLLLKDNDFQTISGKRFPKKSAWRKLAVAFGVDLTIKERVYERNDAGRIIRAEIVATATAPNGRHSDGLGACDAFERCCHPGCKKQHKHCDATCPGTTHFSNAQHDIPATAETRAKNRAASDLFGMGEVSAEEMNAYRDEGWWGGWKTEEDYNAAFGPLLARRKELTKEQRETVDAWLVANGYEAGRWVVPFDDFAEFKGAVESLLVREKGGSTSSIHASASSEATLGAGELNQLPGTTEPAGAA